MQGEEMKPVPLLDLKGQYKSIKPEIKKAIDEVLTKGRFVLGDNVSKLEEEIAAYCNSKYAVGVASGTDALELSLAAMDIANGDEVITTPYTFIATTESVCKVGAKPVFVDIDAKTFNIDPQQIERKITKKTKAIIPVHLYGQACDMTPIMKIAKKHNLRVIEDTAQSIGAEYKGKKAGSFGDTGTFSFFPSKNLGAYGDGGMIVTNSMKIYEQLRILRSHGCQKKYHHLINGYNSRLDEMQAAILRVKLRYLDKWNAARDKNAQYYNQLFKGLDQECIVPFKPKENKHVFYLYTIKAHLRDELSAHLKAKGISSAVYYPIPLHLQEVYKKLKYKKGSMPVSEEASKYILSLPMYPELTKSEQQRVVNEIANFYRKAAK